MLAEERERMHPLPKVAHDGALFGQTRKVDRQSTISVGSAIYSSPSSLRGGAGVGQGAWVGVDRGACRLAGGAA